MPRRARLRLADVPVHLIQRGNNRGPCFFANADYRRYLHLVAQLAPEFGCVVHAYVLMTNHVHLLLTPRAVDSTSLLMKHVGQRYVQHVNRTYARSGTLWEGRFKSCLVQSGAYLLACCRYIELNPVRAGMVAHPRDYPWSSHRANAEGRPDGLVVPHGEFERLGTTPQARRAAYRGLFDAGLDCSIIATIRDATNGNIVLGNASFRSEVEAALGRRAGRGKPGRPWPSLRQDAE
jgi:putative transposase